MTKGKSRRQKLLLAALEREGWKNLDKVIQEVESAGQQRTQFYSAGTGGGGRGGSHHDVRGRGGNSEEKSGGSYDSEGEEGSAFLSASARQRNEVRDLEEHELDEKYGAGFKLLKMMGFKGGAIGEGGIEKPISASLKVDKKGLGFEGGGKKKKNKGAKRSRHERIPFPSSFPPPLPYPDGSGMPYPSHLPSPHSGGSGPRRAHSPPPPSDNPYAAAYLQVTDKSDKSRSDEQPPPISSTSGAEPAKVEHMARQSRWDRGGDSVVKNMDARRQAAGGNGRGGGIEQDREGRGEGRRREGTRWDEDRAGRERAQPHLSSVPATLPSTTSSLTTTSTRSTSQSMESHQPASSSSRSFDRSGAAGSRGALSGEPLMYPPPSNAYPYQTGNVAVVPTFSYMLQPGPSPLPPAPGGYYNGGGGYFGLPPAPRPPYY
uniref:G-patch domain-containing protein n=1 Tax=Palpitomonas bilix TaxID=652834 RepID=A0A7S3DEP9_9EUKA|mmetsp:Transcript_34643/g.89851  ORF Transcript_34643/g.89851 Transcript_34643/m.89851 type:complete len:431 (+) Transcript_34643:434-1726(+)